MTIKLLILVIYVIFLNFIKNVLNIGFSVYLLLGIFFIGNFLID